METIPKTHRRLLGAFNRTDAGAVPDAASAVPAILAEGSLPSAAEAAAVAVLAEFGRKAEETRQLHASSPGSIFRYALSKLVMQLLGIQ